MTVKEYIEELKKFPEDMEVMARRLYDRVFSLPLWVG